jgi:hypothetical protein
MSHEHSIAISMHQPVIMRKDGTIKFYGRGSANFIFFFQLFRVVYLKKKKKNIFVVFYELKTTGKKSGHLKVRAKNKK